MNIIATIGHDKTYADIMIELMNGVSTFHRVSFLSIGDKLSADCKDMIVHPDEDDVDELRLASQLNITKDMIDKGGLFVWTDNHWVSGDCINDLTKVDHLNNVLERYPSAFNDAISICNKGV